MRSERARRPEPVTAVLPSVDALPLVGLAVLTAGLVAVRTSLALPLPFALALAIAVPGLGALMALTLARHGLVGVGACLLGVGVASSAWNGVVIAPVPITQAALAAATVVLLIAAVAQHRLVRVPPWVWLLGATIAVVTAASLLAPPSQAYFAPRYAEDLPDALADIASLGPAGAVAGLKWLVAAVALPVAVCLAAPGRPRLVPLLVNAWVAGVVVSSTVAVSDAAGLTDVAALVNPAASFTGRQAGLSPHPNHLALGIAMVLPLVLWRLVRATRATTLFVLIVATLVMAGGLVVSGSRAGMVGVVVAAVLTAVADARVRRWVPAACGAATLAVLVALLAVPGLFAALAGRLRLDGSGGADASDTIRAGLAAQAWTDFTQSPLRGIGLTVLLQGHNIYLEALAGGGLILLGGYVLSQVAFLLDAWRLRDAPGLARVLAASGATFLAVGVATNQIADVSVFLPFALVAGLRASRRHPEAAPGPRPVHERTEILV